MRTGLSKGRYPMITLIGHAVNYQVNFTVQYNETRVQIRSTR